MVRPLGYAEWTQEVAQTMKRKWWKLWSGAVQSRRPDRSQREVRGARQRCQGHNAAVGVV